MSPDGIAEPDRAARWQIVAVSLAIRRYVAEKTEIKAVRFITTCLLPPPKRDVLAYLGIPLETGKPAQPAPTIVRKSETDVCLFCRLISG